MFDLFTRRRPKEADLPAQVVTQGAIEIAATPDAVFARLHPASKTNALIEDGFTLSRRADGTVDATHPDMPETVLRLEKITAAPPHAIAFRARFESPSPIGALVRSDSIYKLEALSQGLCTVHITETATLRPGLRGEARKREAKLLAEAQGRHLARLKSLFETA